MTKNNKTYKRKMGAFIAIAASVVVASTILPEIAVAGSKFDIDAGVKAATAAGAVVLALLAMLTD